MNQKKGGINGGITIPDLATHPILPVHDAERKTRIDGDIADFPLKFHTLTSGI